MAPEDLGDPEPMGLASDWSDAPPARRAVALADECRVTFQATPVRVDEAFPEYAAYRAAPEMLAFDVVVAAPVSEQPSRWGDTPVVALPPVPRTEEYGWVAGSLDPQHQPPVAAGLAPYPMTAPGPGLLAPTDTYAIPAPLPAAYALAATPNPYQTLASQPMTPGYLGELATTQPPAQGMPDIYATAAPQSTYDIETSGSQNDVALMAVGGTLMVLKKVLTIIPFVIFAAVITFFAATMGGTILWAMAGFAWLATLVALFGRPANASTPQQRKNIAAMMRMYVGK
jgi:hypothetical protein